MNKLKLDLDELSVESFQPLTNQPPAQGTVRANSGCRWPGDPHETEFWSTCDATVNGEATCREYCPSYGGCVSEWQACGGLETMGEPTC